MLLKKIQELEASKGERVLVIDDDMSCSIIAASALLAEGCKVEVVNSGFEALEVFESRRFDLIVLDWNMPKYDGRKTLEVLEQLMKRHSLNVPFVLYTGVDPQDISLPHTSWLHLVDFWNKDKENGGWQRKVSSIVDRLRRKRL